MRVNHLDDYDTHAVIGGKEVKEFAISQSAEFFTVLSSSLYSDKPLAVVREVLCNAWDAHIASGMMHIPVSVKFIDGKLIIRDYGKGINPDKMHETYCVYGNSTKANDGLQTGGFGLGSKAPFAYTDHFTVTTNHNKLKTVYAISRGSVATQGRPDMRTMVKVPTIETGLEVSIPIKSADINTFKKLVKQVASFGEMNVNLDDEIIKIVPISQAENAVFITRIDMAQQSNNKIYVRYGNVIYPVENNDEYKDAYQNMLRKLSLIPSVNSYNPEWKIILQARPNTISVTPSRESIQMTDTTIVSINELLNNACDNLIIDSHNFYNMMLDVDRQIVDKLWMSGRASELIGTNNIPDQMGKNIKAFPDHLLNIKDIAYHFCYHSEDDKQSLNFKYHRMLYRLDVLIKGKYTRYQDLIKYRNYIKHLGHLPLRELVFRHNLNKMFIRPIIKGLVKNPSLNHKNFYVGKSSYDRGAFGGLKLEQAFNYYPQDNKFVSYLKGIVILTYSKKTLGENYIRMNSAKLFPSTTCYTYLMTRVKGQLEQAKAFFEKRGFIVIDFASFYDEYLKINPPCEFNIDYKPKAPKPNGLPVLSIHNMTNKYQTFTPRGHFRTDEDDFLLERIEQPNAVMKAYNLSGSEYSHNFFAFTDGTHGEYAKDVIRLFGSKIGIVSNQPQYENWIKKGCEDGTEYIIKSIFKEINNNKRIMGYFDYKEPSKDIPYGVKELLEFAPYSLILRERYNLPEALTEADMKYINVYNHIKKNIGYETEKWQKLFSEENKIIKNIKVSSDYKKFKQIVSNSKMIDLLDLEQMKIVIKRKPNLTIRTYIEISIINALES